MSIDRETWVRRNHPAHRCPDPAAPFTVGNGDFAFTADITGLQTLYDEYKKVTPLCAMANWGWHTVPAATPSGLYTLNDVAMTSYDFQGREVRYAKEKYPGNETVYDWLRTNPHKVNLARIGFRLRGEELSPAELSGCLQILNLWDGVLESEFLLRGVPCRVTTCCDPLSDTLAFRIESPWLKDGLTVDLDFPYGSPDITGSDWNAADRHETVLEGQTIRRREDDLTYTVRLNAPDARIALAGPHRVRIAADSDALAFTCAFAREAPREVRSVSDIEARCAVWWHNFWNKGGAVDCSPVSDPRGRELERRIVLSLYLLAVNSAGHLPPAETGLTCNSWYGKFHLEMHFWHMAWAPLWGHGDLLCRSLAWYHQRLPEARENAARNGYRGARWPKMVADTALDSPSSIAVLLVWQQPHILTMLELLRRSPAGADSSFMEAQWPLIAETADFMADFAAWDESDGYYHLEPPLIPVQECYDPVVTRDPAFEVAYWKFGLEIAIRWAEALGREVPELWRKVAGHMVPPPVRDGLYLSHTNCPEVFEKFNTDHPSMLQCLGVLPGADIRPEIMAATLRRVTECWDEESLWGWDFAVMAMTAARLGDAGAAVELLLRDTAKNTYVKSGNNRQSSRADLPLYLPGNGSLLLAVAALAAGWDSSGKTPGFDPAKGWNITFEGILPYV